MCLLAKDWMAMRHDGPSFGVLSSKGLVSGIKRKGYLGRNWARLEEQVGRLQTASLLGEVAAQAQRIEDRQTEFAQQARKPRKPSRASARSGRAAAEALFLPSASPGCSPFVPPSWPGVLPAGDTAPPLMAAQSAGGPGASSSTLPPAMPVPV